MHKQTNNTREQIIALMSQANSKIQIAVSWLTDEILINQMMNISKKVQLEILLSNDPLNAFRYSEIRNLQKSGVKVLKMGSNFPGQEGFMHAKFIIIDEKIVFGGSYNFTKAANENFENFDKYSNETLNTFISNFTNWFLNAKDYTIGFENPEAIQQLVKEQFELNTQMRTKLNNVCEEKYNEFINNEVTERELLINEEIRKEELRKQAGDIQAGETKINSKGILSKSDGIVSKPHRFYGGSYLKTKFNNKMKGSFSIAYLQKKELEQKFPFLKCSIVNDTLIARGIFQPDKCGKYDIRIEYRRGSFPNVYILNPSIRPNSDIHIYNEGSLCLFYPGDLNWKESTSISEYTIPWIFEWIIFYEIYLMSGIWEGNFVSHGNLNNTINRA